jgi:mannose-6-phosphate isomerase-like protein (cupin superfamily)
MKNKEQHKVVFGDIGKIKKQETNWGSIKRLFNNWGELKISGTVVEIRDTAPYTDWALPMCENLFVVERGSGTITFRNKKYSIRKGFAVKLFASQVITIRATQPLRLFSIQKPSSLVEAKKTREDLGALKVVNVRRVSQKVYEYETLAREIFTPKYKNSLGLLWFIFPMREIPFHIHPHSGRVIRPISGKGWTYAEPNLYEMSENTFSLFPKGTVHTNGPVAGDLFQLYAFQLPYIASGIDEKNIAGSPRFVKYIGTTPPKKLWKKKADFQRIIRRLSPNRKIKRYN